MQQCRRLRAALSQAQPFVLCMRILGVAKNLLEKEAVNEISLSGFSRLYLGRLKELKRDHYVRLYQNYFTSPLMCFASDYHYAAVS